MDKYLISKAQARFSKRLHVLSESILLAKQFNRILLVDWQAEDSSLDFSYYFSLVDLPYIDHYGEMPSDLPIFPDFWAGQEQRKLGNWCNYYAELINVDLRKNTISEDIWVYAPTNQEGIFSLIPLLQHLRINSPVLSKLQPYLQYFDRLVASICSQYKQIKAEDIALIVLSEQDLNPQQLELAYRQLADSINAAVIVIAESPQQYQRLNLQKYPAQLLPSTDLNLIEWQLLLLILLGKWSNSCSLNKQNILFQLAKAIGKQGISRMLRPVNAAQKLQTSRPNFYQWLRSEAKPFSFTWPSEQGV